MTIRIHLDDHDQHDQAATPISKDSPPSVIMHEEDVHVRAAAPLASPSVAAFPASPSSLPAAPSSASSSSSASAPVEPSWLASLRADWDNPAALAAARAARLRELEVARSRRGAATVGGGRVLLSPAVEAMPPLQGDVVWHATRPYRRLTTDQYETYLQASKLKQYRFHRMVRQIASMFQPVVLLCVLIFVYSQLVVQHARNPKHAWAILVYKQAAGDSTRSKFAGSLVNALTVLAAILAITFTFIGLYWLEWKQGLRRFLIGVIMALLGPWVYFGLQVVEYYDLRVDALSYGVASLQFLACGYFALVVQAETPHNINRCYLIALAVSVAWPFMEFTEWTVWTTIIVLTIYGQTTKRASTPTSESCHIPMSTF